MIAAFHVDRPSRVVNNAMKPLTHTVARYCDALARLPDLKDPSIPSTKTPELAALYTTALDVCQHLQHIGKAIDEARGGSVSRMQLSLHGLQHAYRALQGLMIGMPDRLLDHSASSSAQETIRQLLQATLNTYQLCSPSILLDDSSPIPEPVVLHAVPASPLVAREPVRQYSGSLSTLFERSEHLHNDLVDNLCSLPDQTRDIPVQHRAAIDVSLCKLESHLLGQQAELDRLLRRAAHRRTAFMRLAHRIFSTLGYTEGAMIGAESPLKNSCHPLIDVIAAHTHDLSRRC